MMAHLGTIAVQKSPWAKRGGSAGCSRSDLLEPHFRIVSELATIRPQSRPGLGRAAVMLLTGDDSILDVALSCGFQSHEAFIRAFRRCFAMTPNAYPRSRLRFQWGLI